MGSQSCEVVDGLRHIIVHLRYDRGDNDTLDISGFQVILTKPLFQLIAKEGNRFFLACLEAPGVGDITLLVSNGNHNGRVTDIYQNVHILSRIKSAVCSFEQRGNSKTP